MKAAEYREFIYDKAKEVKTLEQLQALLKEVEQYDHSYDTVIFGLMAAMKATFNYLNNQPKSGGITGFQAGCLGWECVGEFMFIRGPARLVDYDKMLYPQYEKDFVKTIEPETWSYLQKTAAQNLKDNSDAHPAVIAHWKSVVNGKVPFNHRVVAK